MQGMPYDYRYFTAYKVNVAGRKTPLYTIVSKKDGSTLGMVRFHAPWRKWVFAPNNDVIWDTDCLDDVNRLLQDAQRWYVEWKNSLKALRNAEVIEL